MGLSYKGSSRWPAGVSGNLNGRPPKSKEQKEFEETCRTNWKRAWEIIDEGLRSTRVGERQWAAMELLDRGFGKSKIVQDVDLSEHNDTPSLDGVHKKLTALGVNAPGAFGKSEPSPSGSGVATGK